MSYNGQRLFGFFKRFKKGAPVAACNLHRDLERVYNILEKIEGRNGVRIHKPLTGNGVGWIIDGGEARDPNTPGIGVGYAKCFDIYSIADESVEIGGLFYLRGDVMHWQDGTLTAALMGTSQYVSALVDTVDGTITLAVSAVATDVFPYVVPDDSKTYKIPLYHLIRQTISETETEGWRVLQDFRGCPVLLYQ